ncbi:MAG: triose-phosphate isomerase, partial [Paracoccaceae bacterium]|nr:triose-phosphate isomerase [Paracoccaceae bacterium]
MRKLAAGNWKMNGTAADLAEVTALLAAHPAPLCDMLLCPPATLIARMAALAAGTALHIGGQDCHAAASGAHTGDISAAMLTDAGASHVILG